MQEEKVKHILEKCVECEVDEEIGISNYILHFWNDAKINVFLPIIDTTSKVRYYYPYLVNIHHFEYES